MNKLFTKIAALSAGLAMAIGVGVALGSHGVKAVKAAEVTEMECDFTLKTTGHSNYNSKNDDGGLWAYNSDFTVFSGANNNGAWAYVKMGGKQDYMADFNPVYIKTTTATANPTTKVTVNILANTNTNKSKMGATWKLIVASDSEFANVIDTVDKGTLDITTASLYTFTPTSGTSWAAGSYYKVEWTVTNTSTTNGIVWLDDIKLIYTQSAQNPDEIVVSGEDAVSVGSSIELASVAKKDGSSEGVNQNVVWSSSDSSVAKVSSKGVVTGVSNGTAVITATAEEVSSVYGSLEVTVSNGKTDNLAVVIAPSDAPAGYGDNYITVGGMYIHAKQVMSNSYIQMQASTGIIENITLFAYDIASIELTLNSESTGSGYKVYVSNDASDFTEVTSSTLYANRLLYNVVSSGNRYFKIVAGSGTLRMNEILVGLGNSDEAKLVTLAASLNDLLDAECTGAEDDNPISASAWADVADAFDDGDSDAKTALQTVSGLSYHEVNQFLERYDFIVGAYGYSDFLNRNPAPIAHFTMVDETANNSFVLIIIAIAGISAISLGVLLVLRKRKQR